MASELKHDYPIIIKQCSVAFSSTLAKNINALVKMTVNISPYQDVGNECMNIEANRCISYILRIFDCDFRSISF